MKTEEELIWESYTDYLEESRKQQRIIDKFILYDKTPRDATVGELTKLIKFYKDGRFKLSQTKSGLKIEDSKTGRNVTLHSDKSPNSKLDPRSIYHIKLLLTDQPITN
jgi:hypothetical protein